MNLYEIVQEWIRYEPFEHLVKLDDVFHDITIRRRFIDHKDDLVLQHRDESGILKYAGIVVGRISSMNNWVRVRGRYFSAADPRFFEKLERELADACVNPEVGWADDPH